MAIQWNINYPIITDNTTGTSVTASGSINQSGVIYFEILASGLTAPSAAQVAAHTNASGVPVVVGMYDSKVVSASGVLVNLSGVDIVSETNYVAYFAASGYVDGILSEVHSIAFTTPDITSPTLAALYPTASSITTSTAVITLKYDQVCSGYCVALLQGATAPTTEQILAGTDSNDAAIGAGLYGTVVCAANTDATIALSNLHYSKTYTIYCAAKDASNNITTRGSVTFRAAVPKPASPGRYNIRNVTKERRKIANQIVNTLRGN